MRQGFIAAAVLLVCIAKPTTAAARGFASPYAGAYFMALALADAPNPPAPVVYSCRFAEL